MCRFLMLIVLLLTDLAIAANCADGARLKSGSQPLLKKVLQNPLYRKQLDVVLLAIKSGIPVDDFADELLVWPLNGLDTKHRGQLAAALNLIGERAQRRLYVDLPESSLAQGEFTFDDRLARARTLSTLNKNAEVLDTLKSDLQTFSCEAYFLAGRAERRQRHYQAAKDWLMPVIKNCDGDIKREAFFIAARLAAMNSSQEDLLLLNEFLKTYPEHHYADDVSLWKISVLADVGSDDEVDQAYVELIEKYPQGDQASNAVFRQAFRMLKKGKTVEAIEQLKTRLSEDRFAYWYGRLNIDESNLKLGLQTLSELYASSPNSYYGFLAKHWLDEAKVSTKITPEPKIKIKASDALAKDERYREAQCLIKKGYSEQAVMFLDDLRRTSLTPIDRMVLANDFKRIKRFDKTHQVMREGGFEKPLDLAYPKAYKAEIGQAAKKAKIPASLLFGLAREESTFDAEVISWAGAYGLCQLMPMVVKKDPILLLDPKLNAQLGAQHFADELKELKHPILAIAAYNAGASSVKRWVKRFGEDPLDMFVEQIPFEQTRNYVKKVTSAWLTYAAIDDKMSEVKIPFYVNR